MTLKWISFFPSIPDSVVQKDSPKIDSDDKLQPQTLKSQEQTAQSTTSATSSKCGESIEAISSPSVQAQVSTKGEEMGTKDTKTCFCCLWEFPQSFKGEDKNLHIDRCMEGHGEKDKQFWAKCQGDIKQYR